MAEALRRRGAPVPAARGLRLSAARGGGPWAVAGAKEKAASEVPAKEETARRACANSREVVPWGCLKDWLPRPPQ